MDDPAPQQRPAFSKVELPRSKRHCEHATLTQAPLWKYHPGLNLLCPSVRPLQFTAWQHFSTTFVGTVSQSPPVGYKLQRCAQIACASSACSNLPGPSKSSASGRVSPRDIIRILSICHSGPQTSSGKLPAVPHSKLPAASASAAERLASPGGLGKGGGSSVQPLAFGSPSQRPASGSVPAVEVDAQPVWAPPGVVTQPAIPGGPKA